MRRDIHAHPELCFEENRTPDLIAKALSVVHRDHVGVMQATRGAGLVEEGEERSRARGDEDERQGDGGYSDEEVQRAEHPEREGEGAL